IRALSRDNEARWQAAFNLANAMRAERKSTQPKLAGDPQLAAEMARILDREIETGSSEGNKIALRMYLSRALGEFRVTDGLPTLIKAATIQRSDAEGDVRRAAIEGIAVLADNLNQRPPKPPVDLAEDAKLRDALLKAAEDSDPRTRSVAAVAMGVVGGPV